MTTTLTRTSEPTEQTSAARVEIRNAKGQTVTVQVWSDGSSKPVDGALWLLGAMSKQYGATTVRQALRRAATTGTASLD